MYGGLPITVVAWERSRKREVPKSATLQMPLSEISTLAGRRSRWRIWASWACSTPFRICTA